MSCRSRIVPKTKDKNWESVSGWMQAEGEGGWLVLLYV